MAWGDEQRGELPVLFGALEGSMVAGVVPRELGGGQGGQKEVEEGVHSVRLVGPLGKTLDGNKGGGGGGGRRLLSGGGEPVVRPVSVLPLRRLFLARCGWLGKGWDVRMGRAVVIVVLG